MLSFAALGACGDDDGDGGGGAVSAEDLEGRTFVSSGVEGQELVDGTTISLSFEGTDAIAVNAGCNGMMGGYTIEDGTLTTGELAQTMMACEEPLMAQDQWVAAFLADGPTIALDGDELTLTGGDVTVTAVAES